MKSSNDYRQKMVEELSEIQAERNELARQITKNLLNNYTSHELVRIANAISIWDSRELLKLL